MQAKLTDYYNITSNQDADDEYLLDPYIVQDMHSKKYTDSEIQFFYFLQNTMILRISIHLEENIYIRRSGQ